MNLWAVSMVKDERDILPYTISHLLSEGVTGFIIADNLSTDGTKEWLHSLQIPAQLEVVVDEEIAYYQAEKLTRLARMAIERGANWVLPFDADELWHSTTNEPIVGYLSHTLGDCLHATLYNYFPSRDDPDIANPYQRITRRDLKASPLAKVLIRGRSEIALAQGNHEAQSTSYLAHSESALRICHFPWRSPEQFETKIRNGSKAYAATDLAPDIGLHWRQYGELLERGGPEALREQYFTWFCDPALPLTEDPAPWQGTQTIWI
jgi:glycosyltransferase involved in cell wall biosynthesis